MTQADLLELSRHGDLKAITQLINRAVQPLKITVWSLMRVFNTDNSLPRQVTAIAPFAPE